MSGFSLGRLPLYCRQEVEWTKENWEFEEVTAHRIEPWQGRWAGMSVLV
jgi:hypothetical protein